MEKSKKVIFVLILISIIFIISTNLSPQENTEKAKLEKQKKEPIIQKKTEKSQERKQQKDYSPEKILGDAQKTFDRSINILNIVVGALGALVGILTLIFIVGGIFGIVRYQQWKKIIKNAEKDAQTIRIHLENVEKEVSNQRKKVKEFLALELVEKPSNEIKEKLDDFSNRLEIFEASGIPLKAVDYITRGNDLFYKEKYNLSLVAYEQAIEIEPDNMNGWNNKSSVLIKLKRYDEAYEASERAVEIEPNDVDGLINKGISLYYLDRYDEALEAYNKIIEFKPDYSYAWFNKACVYAAIENKDELLISLAKAIELNAEFKKKFKKDKGFKFYWEDDDFKRIII